MKCNHVQPCAITAQPLPAIHIMFFTLNAIVFTPCVNIIMVAPLVNIIIIPATPQDNVIILVTHWVNITLVTHWVNSNLVPTLVNDSLALATINITINATIHHHGCHCCRYTNSPRKFMNVTHRK